MQLLLAASEASDSRRITFRDGSKDSDGETRQLVPERAQAQGWIGVHTAGGNCETCQAVFGYLTGACCFFISSIVLRVQAFRSTLRYPIGPFLGFVNLCFTSPVRYHHLDMGKTPPVPFIA